MLNRTIWKLLILCHSAFYVESQWFHHYTTGVNPYYNVPDIEREHDPRYTPERVINGTEMPHHYETPDWRIEETAWYRHYNDRSSSYIFYEVERPYRLSPSEMQLNEWARANPTDDPRPLGCYCTTVYKRLTLLAGCAVLTRKHILTTASSTELVLQHYRNVEKPSLENILGAWYDMDDHITYNSSIYMHPVRIHYHPRFTRPQHVNHTHPLPFLYDLAVWTAAHDFYFHQMGRMKRYAAIFYSWYQPKAVLCVRGAPHSWQFLSSTPRDIDLAIIVGFQFMKAARRKPMPWFKYAVKTRGKTVPCPKADWAWFHCMPGNMWSKYGLESGVAWHRALEGRYWIYDGLIALNAFNMRLRSALMTHYFTVLNTHPVLEFLYDAYMGRMPYDFLDYRYHDTQWKAPVLKAGMTGPDDPYYEERLETYYVASELPIY